MIRLIVGAVLAAVVLFAWGFVFWAHSGIMYRFTHRLPNEDEVVRLLQKDELESGTYRIPLPDPEAASGADADKTAAYRAQAMRGPLVDIIYRKEGLDPLSPSEMVAGFCHYLAAALVAGVLLVLAQPGLQRYLARVLFVTLLGVFACVAIAFAKPIWFHQPWPAVLYESGYNAVGWLLAGLPMGLVIRPPRVKPEVKTAAILSPALKERPAAPPPPETTPPAEPPNP